MKILIIQTASIGDVILATPVAESLHEAYPSAEINLMIKKGMEGLFHEHPFLCGLIVWDKSEKYRDFGRILSEIRKQKFDLIINVQRFVLTGLLTAFSGSKATIGFDKNPFSFLFTKRIKHLIGRGRHEVERNLSLILHVLPAGQRAKELANIRRPQLYPSPSDEARVIPLKIHPFVTLSPASLWFTKQYPAEKWVDLINSLDSGIHIHLLGSSADHPLCEKIKTLSGRVTIANLAGSLSFLESAALMRDALMNYTNDSAPMHLASAVNAPVSVVYCSTVPEFGFGPLSSKHWIIETGKQLKCRPCGLHGRIACPLQHFECAKSINAEQFPIPEGKIPKM